MIASGKGELIWIVEDDKDIRDVTVELLEMEGYQVRAFGNGQEAIDGFRAGTPLPCVILLDLMMPIMDGWEFRRQQLAEPRLKDIPVVVATANGSSAYKAQPMANVDLVRKPIDVDELLAKLAKHCVSRTTQ